MNTASVSSIGTTLDSNNVNTTLTSQIVNFRGVYHPKKSCETIERLLEYDRFKSYANALFDVFNVDKDDYLSEFELYGLFLLLGPLLGMQSNKTFEQMKCFFNTPEMKQRNDHELVLERSHFLVGLYSWLGILLQEAYTQLADSSSASSDCSLDNSKSSIHF